MRTEYRVKERNGIIMESMNVFVGVMGVAGFLLLAVGVALYVVNALGVSYVLRALEFQYHWFAWIPVLNYIALSYAAYKDDEEDVNLFGIKLPVAVFSLWYVAYYLLQKIPGVGGIFGIVCKGVFYGKTLQSVYAKMENRDASEVTVIAYASAVIELIAVVKFMLYRSRGSKQM